MQAKARKSEPMLIRSGPLVRRDRKGARLEVPDIFLLRRSQARRRIPLSLQQSWRIRQIRNI